MNDAKSLCRICLQEGATIPIFEKCEQKDNVHTRLTLCISEKIEDVEGFPRHICSFCDSTLDTISNFIQKYRESSKILENAITVKKEVFTTSDDEDRDIYEVEVPINNIKTESDELVANIVESLPTKVKKTIKNEQKVKKKTKCQPLSGNQTNKIASSILEGNFLWTDGEKWCIKIGQTTLKRLPTKKAKAKQPKLKRQPKIKAPPLEPELTLKLCDLCGEVFPTQDRLSSHKKQAHFKQPVQCPKCPRVCVSEYYLNRHIKRKHTAIKEFICSMCGQGFAFKGELASHHKRVHSGKPKPTKVFACKLCNKTYKCAKSVVVHERSVHTGQRPAECGVCGSCFYHIDYLREHMRLHTGETPFKCPICGRGYAQRCNMKSHLRIHRVSELDAVTLSKLRPNYLKLLKA